MMSKNILFALTLVAIFCPTLALTLEIPSEPLKGLEVIGVFVEAINPEAVRDGLTSEQLQTDVELRLRKAGIRVDNKFKQGFLRINVNARKTPLDLYSLTISVEFIPLDYIIRYPNIVSRMTTWSRGYNTTIEARHLNRYVRDKVANLVDMFINDHITTKP